MSENIAYGTSFGTIRNNTALKQSCWIRLMRICFGTIRNNTALKHILQNPHDMASFGTIRNNTALKPTSWYGCGIACFGTIRNNTALKPKEVNVTSCDSFGTIRNNTALKPRRKIFLTKFRNRAIRPSQTSARQVPILTLIIPYFQGSRNSLDPAHIAGNHRLFEVQQIRLSVD